MDQIWALWLVVRRTNRRDVAPSGGRTKQTIKASGEQWRAELSTGSLGGFSPVIWIQSRTTPLHCSLHYFTTVLQSDTQTDFVIKQSTRWSTQYFSDQWRNLVLCLSVRTFEKLNIHFCETFFFKRHLKIPKVVFDWSLIEEDQL